MILGTIPITSKKSHMIINQSALFIFEDRSVWKYDWIIIKNLALVNKNHQVRRFNTDLDPKRAGWFDWRIIHSNKLSVSLETDDTVEFYGFDLEEWILNCNSLKISQLTWSKNWNLWLIKISYWLFIYNHRRKNG